MATGSAKGQTQKERQEETRELLERARETSRRESSRTVRSEREEAAPTKFADIAANTFYQIMFDPNLDPNQKLGAVAKALTFTESKEQSDENLEAFKRFKEYLQYERKRMAQQIIDLTDTEAFSELKTVYDELNSSLLSFEERIGPLTDIVDAVYTLRMNGLTFDAFKEIALDKEAEARIAQEVKEREEALQRLTEEMRALNERNAVLGEDKAFFGLGGVKKSAREEIARNEVKLQDKERELDDLTVGLEKLVSHAPDESELGDEFVAAKTKLRELLDISSDEHKQRQEQLVSAAQAFVDSTETRVASISDHFDGMDKQIDNLLDANYSMREIYAVLNDATKEAHAANERGRDGLQPAGDDDSDLQAINRERKKRDLENYISSLNTSSVDTTMVLGELTNSGHRIKSMKDGNEQQIAKTRQLHSSGVAGVADQLSTVLQAVSAAALGESSEMARMSLERMNTKTQELSQKEVIRVALGTHDQNTELSKALADLEQYGEVIRAATNITREGLRETKDLLGKLEDSAREVQEDVKASISVAAEVVAGKGEADNEEPGKAPAQETDAPNPFNLGRD